MLAASADERESQGIINNLFCQSHFIILDLCNRCLFFGNNRNRKACLNSGPRSSSPSLPLLPSLALKAPSSRVRCGLHLRARLSDLYQGTTCISPLPIIKTLDRAVRPIVEGSPRWKEKATPNCTTRFSSFEFTYIEVHGHIDVDNVAILQSKSEEMSGACSYSKTNAKETQ
jgi:hypothetical protein